MDEATDQLGVGETAPDATPSGLGRLVRRPDPVDAPRPVPNLASMLAVGAGLLVAAGLFFILGEVDGFDQRPVALGVSVLFMALGVAISTINRSSRSAAAGVVISALGVVPLTVYLYANADLFGELSGGEVDGNPWDGARGIATLMLATAAVLWLLGYFVGPGRRFGFYLGAALLAIWLIPVTNLQITAYEETFEAFETGSAFEPVPLDDFNTDSGFDSSFEDDFGTDDFESQFDEDFTFEEPDIPDPSTKLGVVSLAFGVVYLAFAAFRDRKGDVRMATAVLVPAIVTLLWGASLLTDHVGWGGAGALGIAVGGALLAVGIRAGRRATSWIGIAVATLGFGSLIANALSESPRAIGAVLTVLGVVLALVVGRLEGRNEADPTPDTGAPADPGPEPFPAGPPPAPNPFGIPAAGPAAPPAGPTFTPPVPPPAPPGAEPSPWAKPF